MPADPPDGDATLAHHKREWEEIEGTILAAEARVAEGEAAVSDSAILSNAVALAGDKDDLGRGHEKRNSTSPFATEAGDGS